MPRLQQTRTALAPFFLHWFPQHCKLDLYLSLVQLPGMNKRSLTGLDPCHRSNSIFPIQRVCVLTHDLLVYSCADPRECVLNHGHYTSVTTHQKNMREITTPN